MKESGDFPPTGHHLPHAYPPDNRQRPAHVTCMAISWVSLAVELQRGWAREETVPAIVEIVLTDRLQKE